MQSLEPVDLASTTPLGGVAQAWLKGDRPLVVKETTLARDNQIIRCLPNSFLTTPIAEITASDCLQAISSWKGATNTRRRVRTTLQALFSWALTQELITTSPAARLRIAATDAGRIPNPFTWAEVEDLCNNLETLHPWAADAIRFSAHTGVRAGELRALRVSDYRTVPHPLIIVARSHTAGFKEAAPKSGRIRQIPLDGVAGPIAARRAYGKKSGDRLFTSPSGSILEFRNLRRAVDWKTICPTHTWHDLRHCAAQEWVQLSASLSSADIQNLLGHVSLDTTEKYLRGLSGSVRQAQISVLFQQITATTKPTKTEQ